jgi:two-component system chemotaxis response regulator CheY
MKYCLIVDDSVVVRKAVRKILENLGFICTEAENGIVAYEACQETMPDAIILDWHMPVLSGIDFLKKLRKIEGGGKPKVIFCTIENDTSHIKQAIIAGADEYITKPFDSDVIKSKFLQVGLL